MATAFKPIVCPEPHSVFKTPARRRKKPRKILNADYLILSEKASVEDVVEPGKEVEGEGHVVTAHREPAQEAQRQELAPLVALRKTLGLRSRTGARQSCLVSRRRRTHGVRQKPDF